MGKWKVVRNLERKHVCRTTIWMHKHCTKNKFFLRISSVMRIWSHLLKKFLSENFMQQKKHHQQNIYRTFANLIKNVKIEKFCTKSTVRQGTWWCITSRSMHLQYIAKETSRRISKERKRTIGGSISKSKSRDSW